MDFWRSAGGMVRAELTCADPALALKQITDAGITAYDVSREEGTIVITFSIRRTDRKILETLAAKRGYMLRFHGFFGIYWMFRSLLRRPVMVVGLLVFCFLALFLPGRVLFVQVEGNSGVPTRLILEKCQESGIYFGASRRQIRSEIIKNSLLEAIPELQWAGVNTKGCVAVVSVRERTEDSGGTKQTDPVSSIVALRDGIITRCTVTKGSQLCSVGQAVRAGQVLVSGYWDCGICIQAGPSEAEIYAQTERQLRSVMPLQRQKQVANGTESKKYSLIIGKKRINFYKGSGISGGSCDKMYAQYYITLPGGFVLPVSIVTETSISCDTSQIELEREEALAISAEFNRQYLQEQMIAGAILHSEENEVCLNSLLLLEGNYACEEMIAQVKSEEIGLPNG